MDNLRIFYCLLPEKGVALVSAFNRGHAVKNINKQLKAEDQDPLPDSVSVLEFHPMENKNKGVVLFLK